MRNVPIVGEYPEDQVEKTLGAFSGPARELPRSAHDIGLRNLRAISYTCQGKRTPFVPSGKTMPFSKVQDAALMPSASFAAAHLLQR